MLAMNLIYIIMATLLLYMYKCRQKPSTEPQPKLDKIKPKVEEPVEDIEQPWGYFVSLQYVLLVTLHKECQSVSAF